MSRRDESGDTLVEVLLAVLIISITAIALLGALVTSITGSSEHRSLSVDDTILKSYAEAAKYVIELSPTATYAPCASVSSYRFVSAPSPTSGPVGASVIVFGSGFAASSALTVQVGATTATVTKGSTSDANGNVAVTFAVPSAATGAYAVTVTDAAAHSATSSTNFTVTSGPVTGADAPQAGYTVGLTAVAYWNGSTYASSLGTCPSTDQGLQLFTATAIAPNGFTQTLQFVVRNPNYTP